MWQLATNYSFELCKKDNVPSRPSLFRDIFMDGYKANKAKYTEEDMKKLYLGTLQNIGTSVKQSDMPTWEQVLQSLKPKPIKVEVEIKEQSDEIDIIYTDGDYSIVPKTVNNIVQVKRWIYE